MHLNWKSPSATVDFMLSEKHDEPAARAGSNGLSEKVTINKSGANKVVFAGFYVRSINREADQIPQ